MTDILREIDEDYLLEHIQTSLKEDIGSGDITTEATVAAQLVGKGSLVSREEGVVAGVGLVGLIYKQLATQFPGEPEFEFSPLKTDGEKIGENELIAEIEGPLNLLLTGERVALNYLQQLSGVATATARLVAIAAPYAVKIYDTRKTVPHLRLLQKYAVCCGGGYNHRISLADAVMIKDNHKLAAGGLKNALEKLNFDGEIVVEIHDSCELAEIANFDIDVLMLDNMKPEQVKEIIPDLPAGVEIEISGGINEQNIEPYCEAGVDRVSVGSLTHSFKSLDISFGLIQNG